MTKSELVEKLAARFPQLLLRDADISVKTILDAMSEALADGHRIEIRGFGSFGLNRRPPRVGRNPKSGERVLVPEKRVPHFKAGKELRERVDRSPGPSHNGQTVHHGNGSHGDHAAQAMSGAQVSAPAGTLHEDGQLNLVRS
ncbi:integration host factor subunit beta [Cupriavidus sp. OV038]|jgi:integration host factor subunit beta|uniref:integration host factor subunit beta n=1 Tax=unclassified Cupriavidus TaxID=2640874 RepID=UPI0008E44B0D|nr:MULTISPECIES: integration host factor subunit beta [unclassified Cupriavidus]SFD07501.1 integration host factor subunit beta [Cupriavidus sp. OV038]SFP78225.1 integration host factor subunit beta [Cupriavidus sp. OV096]